MKLAINPWNEKEELGNIPTLKKYTNGEILYNLAIILDEWPGVSTPILLKKERHNRLIMAIAGYPEIEIGTKPLDWKLHEKSIRAFETSIYLDSVNGLLEKSSLRSELLNVDLNMRKKINKKYENKKETELKFNDEYGKDWENITTECLSILFKVLNSKNDFDDAQEALLASIFSYDNTAGIRKGWKHTFEKLQKIPEIPLKNMKEMRKPNTGKEFGKIRMKIEKGKILSENEEKIREEYEKYLEYKKNEPYYKLIRLNEDEWLYEINFQFYRIQTWMNGLIKYNKSDGTPQRILRGASLILETMISEIRELCMERFGPGSILIDGGGRLRILVSNENEAQKHVKDMNDRFEGFLITTTQGQKRLEEELDRWFMSENVDEKYKILNKKNKNNKGKQKEIIAPMIKNLAESGLPPRKINYIKRRKFTYEGINNKKQLINALNYWGKPPTQKQNKNSSKCPFSNEDIFKKLDKEKWNSVDEWCFKWNYNKDWEVNQNHKFLYIIGHFQRMKDSVLHRPKLEQKTNVKRNKFHNLYTYLEKQDRAVGGLLKLDGNSVGHIFNPKNDDLNDEIIRRRSFRFNAIWWCSIYYALNENEYNGGDRLGAWVVAGDDVLIAEYKHKNEENLTFLEKLMIKLSNNINNTINKELEYKQKRPILTFSAGYTKKQDGGDRIQSMLKRVERNEKFAKVIWKQTIIHDKKKHMMSEEKIKSFKETKNTISEANSKKFHKVKDFDNKFKENLNCYYEDNDEGTKKYEVIDEKGIQVEVNWPEKWDEEKLNDILKKLESHLTVKIKNLSDEDYSKLFQIITRCEKDLDSNKTKILIKNY